MRGESFIINKKILENPGCPIKETIGEISPERIIQVIEDEYWNEWNHLLSYAETSSIYCRNLGKFYVGYSQLRGHMWYLLKELKKLRSSLETFEGKEENRLFLQKKQADYKEKFRCCWMQWEEQRKMFILRTINWNNRLRAKGEEHRIKCHYEQWNWSFVK